MKDYKKASLFKRFAAAIIDLIMAFLLAVIVLSYVVNPILLSATNFEEKNARYNSDLFDVYYLVYVQKVDSTDPEKIEYKIVCDADSPKEEIEMYKNKEISSEDEGFASLNLAYINISFEKYEYYINKFYVSIGDTTSFKQNKLDSGFYNEDLSLKEGIDITSKDKEAYKLFLDETYSSLLKTEKFKQYKNGETYALSEELSTISSVGAYSSYFIAFLVLYLIIPLITRRRETLGKKLMSLQVVSLKDGTIASRKSMVLRFGCFVLIEFFFSLILYYIPLIGSIALMVVNKYQCSLHDYIANTTVSEVTYMSKYADLDKKIKEAKEQEEQESMIIDAEFIEKAEQERNKPLEDNKED